MEKKKVYTKETILNNYVCLPPTPNFNRIGMEKLKIYSETSIDPISLKIRDFNKDTLPSEKSSEFRTEGKKAPPVEDKKEVSSKGTKEVKMAIFSFVTNYMKLNTKELSWHYSLDNKTIKGPLSSEDMDKLWKEDSLPFDKTLIYSNKLTFINPKTNAFNKKELSLEEFVPIDVLADAEVFNKMKLHEKPVAALIEGVQKAVPTTKPEKKKEAKKSAKKKVTKEEKAKQQELMKSEGFAIASKKGKSHQVGESEESDEEPNIKLVPAAQPKAEVPAPVPTKSSEQKEEEDSEEDEFEYIPSKSQTKKNKKKGNKAPSFKPEIYTSVGSVVPSIAKKEPSKKIEEDKTKVEAKEDPKKTEQKKEEKKEVKTGQGSQKSSKKKNKKKGTIDPAILGFNIELPKPELKEPEGWGETAIKPKEVVPLADIMKEELQKSKK